MIIAISGFTGSGKTSLGDYLSAKLSNLGIKTTIIKPSFKDLAKKEGISLMEFQKKAEKDKSIDILFDKYVKEQVIKSTNPIVSTWLSVWLINADVKIFLTAPIEKRARRLVKRGDFKSFLDAIEHVKARDEENRKRYLDIYSVDIYKLYEECDITINTDKYNISEEADIIIHLLKMKGLM